MSVDVGPRVDGSINIWVGGGEVMTSRAIDRLWSIQSKRKPDKGIMNWYGIWAVTVEFLTDNVGVRCVGMRGVSGNFAEKETVFELLVGIPNAPDGNPPLDWIRVVKVISHQQINRIPLSELNLVGLEGLMWVGGSEPKKRVLK